MAVETVSEITNHAEVAISRLPQKYKDPAKLYTYDGQPASAWEVLLEALVKPTESLETIMTAMLAERSINTAEGVNLDRLGDIVGAERRGEGDTRYREVIVGQIAGNNSFGDAKSLLAVAAILLEGIGGGLQIIEQYPAKAIIDYLVDTGEGGTVATAIQSALEIAKSAGVDISSLRGTLDNYFGFSSDPDATGFATISGGVPVGGGHYSTLVTGD